MHVICWFTSYRITVSALRVLRLSFVKMSVLLILFSLVLKNGKNIGNILEFYWKT